jgi:hypothetical protein
LGGSKNQEQKFTGIIMGSNITTSNKTENGLLGFENDSNTFGLLSDGTAYFGKDKQI